LGSNQEDAFQGHWHAQYGENNSIGSGSVRSAMGHNNNVLMTLQNAVRDATSDGVNGVPRTSSETRPKNLTVNMFIKYKSSCNF
jgi:hypothetical protein